MDLYISKKFNIDQWEILDRIYPLFIRAHIYNLVAAIIALTMVIVVFVFANDDTPRLAYGITTVAGGVITFGSLLASVILLLVRRRVRQRVLRVVKECIVIYVRHDVKDTQELGNIGYFNTFFTAATCKKLFTSLNLMLAKANRGMAKDPLDYLEPVTFVTFCPASTVKKRGKVVYGLQQGKKCLIDSSFDGPVLVSLWKHELGHIVLTAAFPSMDEAKQHILIRKYLGV